MIGVAKCHCGNTSTRMVEISPQDSRVKLQAICCMKCSAILGVTDYFDTHSVLMKLAEKIDALWQEVNQIKRQMR
jgi:hypothetical protein